MLQCRLARFCRTDAIALLLWGRPPSWGPAGLLFGSARQQSRSVGVQGLNRTSPFVPTAHVRFSPLTIYSSFVTSFGYGVTQQINLVYCYTIHWNSCGRNNHNKVTHVTEAKLSSEKIALTSDVRLFLQFMLQNQGRACPKIVEIQYVYPGTLSPKL